jgi:hypothetical protein
MVSIEHPCSRTRTPSPPVLLGSFDVIAGELRDLDLERDVITRPISILPQIPGHISRFCIAGDLLKDPNNIVVGEFFARRK